MGKNEDEFYLKIKDKFARDRTQTENIFLVLYEANGEYVPSPRFRNMSMSHRKCISNLREHGFNIENKKNIVEKSWHSNYRLVR